MAELSQIMSPRKPSLEFWEAESHPKAQIPYKGAQSSHACLHPQGLTLSHQAEWAC